MGWNPEAISSSPPLRLTWRSTTGLRVATAADDSLYGVTPAGKLVALRGADGTQRWESAAAYLPHRLAVQGSRLFAYQRDRGLAYIDDNGTSASELLAISFGASESAHITTPLLDDRMVYLIVNQGLYAVHQDQGLQFANILDEVIPHTVTLVGSRSVVVIDGKGIPTRYRVGTEAFEMLWRGSEHGISTGFDERPNVVVGDRLVIGIGPETVAYDLASGRIAWRSSVPARAFALKDGIIYACFLGAALWAIRPSDGAVLWQRQYVYNTSLQREYGLAVFGDYLYFGGLLRTNPDGALLLAVRASDGAFAWLSRSAGGPWAGGLPITDGEQVYAYGASHVGAYGPLPGAPIVTAAQIEVRPRPLRGPVSSFGTGSVRVTLPTAARVSVAAYREAQGLGTSIVSDANWPAGAHEATWNIAAPGGYTDANQFGYLLVDVAETSGVAYTQPVLLPVNTFPDIVWHWARTNIETMAYYGFVNGYPDQTFQPDNLLSRAESCTVIAKTLGREGPSPGFTSKFTDLSGHWSRNYVMALEELGIVGGFLEPDGSFTFRPNLNMTRAQEARILVNAYNISPAPDNFTSKFTDIAGHWAAADIAALEAAGYVNGFREPNGTFTYRPEQNLTRAELCTVVVRIRDLHR